MTTEARTFHFDLSGWAATAAARDAPLTLHVAGERYPVAAHTAQSRAVARGANAALALIPEAAAERLSHFAELPPEAIPAGRVAHLHVTTPNPDPAVELPLLLHVGFVLPAAHRLRNLERRTAARVDAGIPAELRRFGVAALGRADAREVWRDASALQGPIDTAWSLIFHHPQLGSIDGYQATIVMDEHIRSIEHEPVVDELWRAIERQGQYGWYDITVATDGSGRALSYEIDLEPGDTGKPVEIYDLTDATGAAMEPALAAVLRTVSADERLRGRSWTSEPGIAAVHQPELQPSRIAQRDAGVRWTLEDLTPKNGIGADRNSIGMGADRRFSIDVENHHMRTMCAFARFYDDGGRLLSGYPWDGRLDPTLGYDTSDTKALKVIPPRGSIMGIPISVVNVGLEFPFPDDAASVRLLFGGLGQASSWETNVCLGGTIMTGIFNYGLPTLFLVTTAGLTETKWITDLLLDVGLQTSAMIAGAGVMGSHAAPDVKAILAAFAAATGGLLVSKGLEKVARKVTRQMAANQLRGAIPFVGWAFKAAAMAASGAAIGVTTVQTASSPALLRVDVRRTTDLELTLRPDPEHGEAGRPETAVWPGVADNYKITVQYRGGTAFEQVGPMWEETTNRPLVVPFRDIPAGGWLRVIAGIYASNGWLCGHWESEELRALPPAGGGPLRTGGTIREVLVPLSSDTKYGYKQRIAYDAANGGHVWDARSPRPTGTVADRSCANTWKDLCEISSLSLNGSGFQIGYSWQASSHRLPWCQSSSDPQQSQANAFQNLSVLGRPEDRLLFPTCSFKARTLVAYDQFLDEDKPDEVSQRNFFLDPRSDPPHLRQVVLGSGRPQFDLGVRRPSFGTIGLRLADGLAVHPNGFAVASSWADDVLAIAELPQAGVPDSDAKPAPLLAGSGERAGLLRGPKALTVMPDGRILVLETINRRLQAFDTHANPVPSFDGERVGTFAAALASDLDTAELTPALHRAFHDRALTTHRLDLPQSFEAALDGRQVTAALREALALDGLQLSFDPAKPTDPEASGAIEVVRAGAEWRIVDAAQQFAYAVRASGSVLTVRDELAEVTIELRKPGEEWVLTDHASGAAFHLLRTGGGIDVLAYDAFIPLHVGPDETLTPLDVAAEAKGYMYVLSHLGDGTAVADYVLDVYEPSGAFLTRTTGVNAARIAVDLWRNLFALSFDVLAGPGGRTEPTVAQWTPSPPRP